MQFHVSKRLVVFSCFLFTLFCGSAEAFKDRKFVHKEVVETLGVTKDNEMVIPHFTASTMKAENGGGVETEEQENKEDIDKPASNITEPTEKKLTFWSGFIDSLSMIFFVEFGDRVSYLHNLP